MKKQFLALIGGVMVAGLAMAAEVVGNNEAVVIQKAKVATSTGYQFLCVPVAALDITGGNGGTLKLSSVLPPDLYYVNGFPTTVTLGSDNYTISIIDDVKKWTTTANTEKAVDPELTHGTTFWLRIADDFGGDAAPDTPAVFCGQALADSTVPGGNGIVARGNSNSEAKTLSELIPDATNGSMVYAIEKGETSYKVYTYTKFLDGTGAWSYPNPEGGAAFDASTIKIAAGEAFYYIKK